MNTIACLGWGSLVWDPQELPLRSSWFNDGPLIHVEFARQSKNGRITLVLVETESPVNSMWAMMKNKELASAITALRKREDILEKNESKHIGIWSHGQTPPQFILGLPEWATFHNIDHVIWTNLPAKFDGFEKKPSVEEIVQYLDGLTREKQEIAEKYIRFAPKQIKTEYRRRIEQELQWAPYDYE